LKSSATASVSVVIPTYGASLLINGESKCLIIELLDSFGEELNSIAEIIVVADAKTPTEVISRLSTFPKVILENFNEPFNFSKKCNVGFLKSNSDIILFLNDDMLACSKNWIEYIQEVFTNQSVGGVGGLLLTPTGLVQCAGHMNSPFPHIYGSGEDPNESALQDQLMSTRETNGLSGACFAVRHGDYIEVGGMCEDLPNSYNDVDLGFKLKELGKILIYDPRIQFVHYESVSRDPTVNETETALIKRRWGRYFEYEKTFRTV
jgi:GT2 family glycosyltransferase